MGDSTDSFGRALLDSMTSPFEKVLNQQEVKDLGFRTTQVLIARLKIIDTDKELIEVYCSALKDPIRLTVDSKTLESKSNPISISKFQTSEEKSLFFDVIEINSITIPWVAANEALKVGYSITRAKWQEQNIFMTIYNHIVDENQKYLDLKIYYQDKKEFSTGWAPSTEDKEANDWVIKKKT